MKNYELSVVFHPDLEMNLDPALDKVRQIITSAGGKITGETDDGKRRLAYPIKEQTFGIYYYIDVELPSDAPKKINNAFNITDEVIRYLLCKVDPRREKFAAKKAESDKKSTETEEK